MTCILCSRQCPSVRFPEREGCGGAEREGDGVPSRHGRSSTTGVQNGGGEISGVGYKAAAVHGGEGWTATETGRSTFGRRCVLSIKATNFSDWFDPLLHNTALNLSVCCNQAIQQYRDVVFERSKLLFGRCRIENLSDTMHVLCNPAT